jgi:hypothetical protein
LTEQTVIKNKKKKKKKKKKTIGEWFNRTAEFTPAL